MLGNYREIIYNLVLKIMKSFTKNCGATNYGIGILGNGVKFL